MALEKSVILRFGGFRADLGRVGRTRTLFLQGSGKRSATNTQEIQDTITFNSRIRNEILVGDFEHLAKVSS